MSPEVLEVLEVFGENALWRGGDVSEKLGVLHPHGHLSRAKEVSQGLYWQCDLHQAARMVKQGKAKAEDFKLFRGYCGWGEGQLDGELGQNLWFSTEGPAVTSFALAGGNKRKTGARNEREEAEIATQGGTEQEADGLAHAERHWGAALRALGGEYDSLRGIPEEELRWSDNLWSQNSHRLLADQVLGEAGALEEE